MMYTWLLLLGSAVTVQCSVYLHTPRGSNNRLNENSADRKSANRLFDSQNNNRGGYNVGEKGNQSLVNYGEAGQYRMKYFQSSSMGEMSSDGSGQSYLTIEWTNQHGCGGDEDSRTRKQNCNIVLQYMCQPDGESPTGTVNDDYFRNGGYTGRPMYNKGSAGETAAQADNRRRNNIRLDTGYHESFTFYDKCQLRERNNGLFSADQNIKSDATGSSRYSRATTTRQNPRGNRNGYECPEERDYYPYWHATPWNDIAVLTDNETLCQYYEKSTNLNSYECFEERGDGTMTYSRWNNEADCEENDGTWVELYKYLEKAPQYRTQEECEPAQAGHRRKLLWGVPHDTKDGITKECLVPHKIPECLTAPWSRSNHLGNGRDGVASNYTWTLPYFPSREQKRCVFRIRYNISTDDYDPLTTSSQYNGNESPIENNPSVDVGAGADVDPLKLAINTAQFGRTFQDRSHVFVLAPRPDNMQSERIYNLNVRGKRGNIVQTYPAVQYDFHPNTLTMLDGDLVHVQWTGSNNHNNGNPAGDGIAGDDGEGRYGTDRHNIVQIEDRLLNYPLPFESTTMWNNTQVKWIHHGHRNMSDEDLAMNMMSAGYYECARARTCKGLSAERKHLLHPLLDNAPASYGGAVLRFQRGTYHYMCTRNNNFSNRSQKGTIIVK